MQTEKFCIFVFSKWPMNVERREGEAPLVREPGSGGRCLLKPEAPKVFGRRVSGFSKVP